MRIVVARFELQNLKANPPASYQAMGLANESLAQDSRSGAICYPHLFAS